jgi:hypothetical protein
MWFFLYGIAGIRPARFQTYFQIAAIKALAVATSAMIARTARQEHIFQTPPGCT